MLFIDLVGSTALAERLDPEPLRRLLDRYYGICTSAIEAHGGTLEKFIGDAVMAVFGVPATGEDDALRAIYAASEVQQQVAEMSSELAARGEPQLETHSGIASGEAVVIAHAGRDVRVIGDVVNTAARLQSVAGAGEIVVGDETARAVRTSVRLDALPPLTLKGKAQPVPAWRVVDLVPLVDDRLPAAFVGRADELAQIRRLFERALQGRQLCMVSALGAPGIGKSRMLREFLTNLEPDGVTVLRGACPSHGAGLTYRPLTELIESLPGSWDDVSSALADEPAGERAVRCLAEGAGRAVTGAGAGQVGVEEVAWATRLLVESLAQHRPLVLVLEDLQWAEPTFLDLIGELLTGVVGVPVLLMCTARTELLEARPTWGGGVTCATTLELGPLTAEETAALVAGVQAGEVVGQDVLVEPLPDQARDRIVSQSGGNPLFASLMVEFMREAGGDVTVPPTIRPLIEARLDRLPAAERLILQLAATIGNTFTLAQLRALNSPPAPAPEPPAGELDHIVRQLLRRRLVQRYNRADQYRFESAFLRDTAYAMTSKEQRAGWHLTLADWLAGAGQPSCPDGEELARHLEAAYLLHREVHPADPGLAELAVRAARALIASGSRAQHRRDLNAAVSLLERGRDLLPADDLEHGSLAVRISDAWLGLGELAKASDALSQLAGAADPQVRRIGAIQRELIATRSAKPGGDVTLIADELARHPDDHQSWCRFHQLRALRWLAEGKAGAAEAEMGAALERAVAAGSRYEEERALGALCELAQWSPTPIPECMPVCEQLTERFITDRALLVPVLLTAGRLLALAGDLGAARQRLDAAAEHVGDLRLQLAAAALSQGYGLAESLSGAHAAAAGHFQAAASALRDFGQSGTAQTLEIYAARELLRQGRRQEAAAAIGGIDPSPVELRGTLVALAVRAHLAAGDGDQASVRVLVGQAVELLAGTDDPCLAGDVWFELAQATALAGPAGEARTMGERAANCYQRKAAVLPARAVWSWLERLEIPDA